MGCESHVTRAHCYIALRYFYYWWTRIVGKPTRLHSNERAICLKLFDKIIANMVFLPGCKWFMKWAKSWLLATSYSGFRPLGGVCPHGLGAHPSLRGKRDRFGHVLSQQTARFPDALAADYAAAALPLFGSRSDSDVSLADALFGKSVPANTLQPKTLASPGPVQMFCNDGTGLWGPWRLAFPAAGRPRLHGSFAETSPREGSIAGCPPSTGSSLSPGFRDHAFL